MSKEAIEIQTNICLAYVDNAIAEETLIGTSSPPQVAVNRLRAFRSMLTNADALRDVGDLPACYDQFSAAARKCDGDESPIDFVQGDARSTVYTQIVNLMFAVNLENTRDEAYGTLKAQGKL